METVERYSRGARWLHAIVYIVVLIELATGWWWILASYQPSFVENLTGIPDWVLHEYLGLLLIPVFLISCLIGRRGVRTFTAESLRFRRGDGHWLLRWPRAVFTGRFAHHDGHFDPGQRLMNVVLVLTLVTLFASGAGAMFLGGSAGGMAFEVHRWAAFLVTPVLLGHIVVAAGILPGYRGVWRSMHLGGRLDPDVAERIWPEWEEAGKR
jgi:cytochrome b subunit of formate dehydrogenase